VLIVCMCDGCISLHYEVHSSIFIFSKLALDLDSGKCNVMCGKHLIKRKIRLTCTFYHKVNSFGSRNDLNFIVYWQFARMLDVAPFLVLFGKYVKFNFSLLHLMSLLCSLCFLCSKILNSHHTFEFAIQYFAFLTRG